MVGDVDQAVQMVRRAVDLRKWWRAGPWELTSGGILQVEHLINGHGYRVHVIGGHKDRARADGDIPRPNQAIPLRSIRNHRLPRHVEDAAVEIPRQWGSRISRLARGDDASVDQRVAVVGVNGAQLVRISTCVPYPI